MADDADNIRRERERLLGPLRRAKGRERRGRYLGQFRPEFSRLHLEKDLPWLLPLRARYVLVLLGRPYTGRSDALRYLTMAKGFHGYAVERVLAEHLRLPPSTATPQGRALRRSAAEAREDWGDNGVLARWTLNHVRHAHRQRTEKWRPAPRIVITGLNHPEELAVMTELSRSAVFSITLDDDVRRERAVASGLLPREHGVDDVENFTTEDFIAEVDDRSGDGNPEYVDQPGELMEAARLTERLREGIAISSADYQKRGLTPALEKLDTFVATLDKEFDPSQF